MAYTSKELSKKLGINLAKWKRWSREFLPPDPRTGMQCGIARMYSVEEAFEVYFGGYLVGVLKSSIPDAKSIIEDLFIWFRKKGFLPLDQWKKRFEEKEHVSPSWSISILHQDWGFAYQAEGLISLINLEGQKFAKFEGPVFEKIYTSELIAPEGKTVNPTDSRSFVVEILILGFLNDLKKE